MSTWTLMVGVFAKFGTMAMIVAIGSVPLAWILDRMMGGE